jgi:hypothetical protein
MLAGTEHCYGGFRVAVRRHAHQHDVDVVTSLQTRTVVEQPDVGECLRCLFASVTVAIADSGELKAIHSGDRARVLGTDRAVSEHSYPKRSRLHKACNVSDGTEHKASEALVGARLWTVAQGDNDRATA